MSKPCLLYVPVPSVEVGRTLARGLVGHKLAACVNVIPEVYSIYQWEGQLEESGESVLLIKTVQDMQEEAMAFLSTHHPYTCPVILQLEVKGAPASVLEWLQQSLEKSP